LHDARLYRGMAKVGNGCMIFIAIVEVFKGKYHIDPFFAITKSKEILIILVFFFKPFLNLRK
jgi:hypothetical protein